MDFGVSRRSFNLGVNMFRTVKFERRLVEIKSRRQPPTRDGIGRVMLASTRFSSYGRSRP
ncbi:hypothetical protein CFB50_27265 [Burkholderia sp. AU33423]|nr:hypothetical protein CFB50_27265 [Burkholderia sp. AU33423]OXJ31301.1 hypothetical protein CFB82_24180 [Burkholderia sp. HI2714]